MTPEDICAMAEEVYLLIAPQLGVHVECRAFGTIVAGISAARGVTWEYVWDPEQHHHCVRLGDGAVLERWYGNARVVRP